MKDVYVAGIVELIGSGSNPDEVIESLKSVLQKRGHEKLFGNILKGVEKELLKRTISNEARIKVRNEKDFEKNRKQIEATLETLGVEEDPVVRIDSTIVGGFIAEHDHKRIDKSYKSALQTIYQKVTN